MQRRIKQRRLGAAISVDQLGANELFHLAGLRFSGGVGLLPNVFDGTQLALQITSEQ